MKIIISESQFIKLNQSISQESELNENILRYFMGGYKSAKDFAKLLRTNKTISSEIQNVFKDPVMYGKFNLVGVKTVDDFAKLIESNRYTPKLKGQFELFILKSPKVYPNLVDISANSLVKNKTFLEKFRPEMMQGESEFRIQLKKSRYNDYAINKIVEKTKHLIKKSTNQFTSALAPIQAEIGTLKPDYVKLFGIEKYDNLVSALLTNKINQTQFINTLRRTTGNTKKVGSNMVKVFRAGPKKDNFFYVSPSKKYVTKNYASNNPNAVQPMYVNLGRTLDLTRLDPRAVKMDSFVKYLKDSGVKFTKEEEIKLLGKFLKPQSKTSFGKSYHDVQLWHIINTSPEIASAASRSGFNSIKQFETSSFAPDAWNKGDFSYFILKQP